MAIKIVDDGGRPFIEFTEEVHPASGPLSALRYPLAGLWQHQGILIRAYFEAPQIPIEHNEIALFRWEPALSTLRAKYQYFHVPGGAGLFLRPAHVTRMARAWADVPQRLEDICGNFPALSLRDLVKTHM